MEEQQEAVGAFTSCEGCVFSMHELYGKNVQTGCGLALGNSEKTMLELLGEKGADVTEPTEEYPHYIVKGRFCPAARQEEWAKAHGFIGLNRIPDMIERLEREMRIQYDAIITIPLGSHLSEIQNTIDGLMAQKFKPNRIVLVNASGFRPTELMSLVKPLGVLWNIENALEEGLGVVDLIHIGTKKIESAMYLTVEAGFVLPESFTEKVNHYLFVDMDRFLLLRPYDDNHNGMMVQRGISKTIGGFKESKSVVDKITRVLEDRECLHLLANADTICPLSQS